MPSQKSSKSSGCKASGQSNAEKPVTGYRVIKDGWGDRKNFQASYGLRMTPEDMDEGQAILDGILAHENQGRK